MQVFQFSGLLFPCHLLQLVAIKHIQHFFGVLETRRKQRYLYIQFSTVPTLHRTLHQFDTAEIPIWCHFPVSIRCRHGIVHNFGCEKVSRLNIEWKPSETFPVIARRATMLLCFAMETSPRGFLAPISYVAAHSLPAETACARSTTLVWGFLLNAPHKNLKLGANGWSQSET